MAGAPGTDPIFQSKRKAISALLPYAARLPQGKQHRMFEAILRISSKWSSMEFMWNHIGPSITSWFDESSPPSLNHAITIASPCVNWMYILRNQGTVARRAAAVSATPYSEAVGQSVADALLQISNNYALRPHIPIEAWALLKRHPSSPRWAHTHLLTLDLVDHIRGFGDIEILISYFLFIWSEWQPLDSLGPAEMEIIVWEEIRGVGMWRHRDDLIKRLDDVLSRLDRGLEYLTQYDPRLEEDRFARTRTRYTQLKELMVEVDRESMKTLSRAPPNLFPSMRMLMIV